MLFQPSDYIKLKLVSNPDSDHGFDVIDLSSGRPIAGIVEVKVSKAVMRPDRPAESSQRVEIVLTGIPVDFNMPDWQAFVQHRAAVHQQLAAAAQAGVSSTDGPNSPADNENPRS
jgi:hypothetical protein